MSVEAASASATIDSRRVAAALLLVSGVTHVSQLVIYSDVPGMVGPALFGVGYFAIGLGLFGTNRRALWFGATLPAIGGFGGVVRFFFVQANPFSVFHVLIDLIVVPICIRGLLTHAGSESS